MVGAAITGTVSVVDLASMKVTATISTGLHPTGMAFYGGYLLVANTYSDTISVVDTTTNEVKRTINLGLPIKVPGQRKAAYGAAPNSIAVDAKAGIAYVALYNANAIAVVNLNANPKNAVMGMIPVAYAPSSVVLDKADNKLHRCQRQGRRHALFVRNRPRRHRLQHSPGQWHRQHHPRAEQHDPDGDDGAGLSRTTTGI